MADRDIEEVADEDARCADCGAIVAWPYEINPDGRCDACHKIYE